MIWSYQNHRPHSLKCRLQSNDGNSCWHSMLPCIDYYYYVKLCNDLYRNSCYAFMIIIYHCTLHRHTFIFAWGVLIPLSSHPKNESTPHRWTPLIIDLSIERRNAGRVKNLNKINNNGEKQSILCEIFHNIRCAWFWNELNWCDL